MRPALFIAVLVLTVAPMGVGQKQSARGSHRTSVEEAIRKLDNERIQAQIHADATALDRIYAADFIGVGPSGTVRTKPQVILDFTSGDLKFQSITTDDVQVRVYGNTAVETGRSIMNGQDKGKTVPRDTRFTRRPSRAAARLSPQSPRAPASSWLYGGSAPGREQVIADAATASSSSAPTSSAVNDRNALPAVRARAGRGEPVPPAARS